MELKFLSFTFFVLFAAFGSIETTWSSGTSGNSSSWSNNQANHSTFPPFRPFGASPPFTNPGNSPFPTNDHRYRPHTPPPPHSYPVDTRDSDAWLTHDYGHPSNSSIRPNRPSGWPGYGPGTNNGRWAPGSPQFGGGVRNNSTRPLSWPQNRPEENNGRWESGPPRSTDGVSNNSTRLYPSLAYFQNRNPNYQNGQNYNPRYK